MQRRTMATFARVCRDEPVSPEWVSHAGFTPVLQNGDDGLVFSDSGEGLWPVERYLSLVLGNCHAFATMLTVTVRQDVILLPT